MAQAMATAQGFSAPAFGGAAGFPPLACPLPGEAQGRNPRITTATALASLLVHAGVALLLLRDPLPTPSAPAPQIIAPAISLTWTAPPAATPAPIPASVPVQSAPEIPPEPVPSEAVEPAAELPPPVLTAAAVTDLSVPPPVAKPQPRDKTSPEKAQVKKTQAEKPPARPRPVATPVLTPALAPAPVPAPDLPAAAAPSAPIAPTAAAPSSVSLPVPAEPSLLRGEDGVPVSRDARYLEPPKPPEYPRRAVQLGLEGTVVVRALVEGGGVPRTVRIVTGSGVDSLDAAAVRAVSGWKFAVSDHGSLWVEIPVQFRLR